jgi:hypothetical protein
LISTADGTPAETPAAVREWLHGCLVDRDESLRTRFLDMCGKAAPRLWPNRVSAELESLAGLSGKAALSADDNALLIASDTVTGLTSALWNAAVLADIDLDRVGYVPDLDPRRPIGTVRGQVAIVRVPGMSTGTPSGFHEAMRGLGVLGRHLVDAPGLPADEPFAVNLSGGYRAAIPYLIGLAEGLRSVPGNRTVEAYVRHEETQSDVIRLPLRHVESESVIHELRSGWDNEGRRPNKPKDGVLGGYAYEEDRDGGGWRLTPFGEGLRALFGTGEEGLLAQ